MARIDKKAAMNQEVHPKGWGEEIWIENCPEYCGKLLHFFPGKKCSMHFHMNKTETMYLQTGRIDILLIDPETSHQYRVELRIGDSILIPRGQMHQIIAHEESELFEFSTMHEDSDSYRVWKGD